MTVTTTARRRPPETLPKALLLAVAAMVLSALVIVTVARLTGMEPAARPVPAAVVAERHLIIGMSPAGATLVHDVDGTLIADLPPMEAGFINGVWRALARERRKHGVAEDAAVTLRAYANGRLALEDPLSGWNIELIGFGQTNSQSFESLLKH